MSTIEEAPKSPLKPTPATALSEPDTSTPIGEYKKVWLGYSSDPEIRQNAASGGIISGLVISLLESGKIDGALLCSSSFSNGEFVPNVFIATSREEVLNAQTSKYYDIPILPGLKKIEQFQGRVAVVGLPSQINSISRRMAKNADLNQKIVLKIAIFCGHNSKALLAYTVLKKKKIAPDKIQKFSFRKGLWRGRMTMEMVDGETIDFPFQDFSHYQNLHIHSLDRCLNCYDHMGYYADIATGDVWTREEMSSPIKKSIFLARSNAGEEAVNFAIQSGAISATESDRKTLYRSQKRSINYHYNITARARLSKFFGLRVLNRIDSKPRIRDYFAAAIVLCNHRISRSPRLSRWFMRIPKPFIIAYVYLFKSFTHYDRGDY